MKKLNNKGFLLVETIVVATFTLTVLIVLFLQFKNLLVSYNNSYNYNTVEGIYDLKNVKKYISQYENKENTLTKQLSSASKPYLVFYNGNCNVDLGIGGTNFCEEIMKQGNFKTVLFSHSDATDLKNYLKSNEDSNISENMKILIKSLKKVENQNRLIAEFTDGTLATIVFGNNDNSGSTTNPGPGDGEGTTNPPGDGDENNPNLGGGQIALAKGSGTQYAYISNGQIVSNVPQIDGQKATAVALTNGFGTQYAYITNGQIVSNVPQIDGQKATAVALTVQGTEVLYAYISNGQIVSNVPQIKGTKATAVALTVHGTEVPYAYISDGQIVSNVPQIRGTKVTAVALTEGFGTQYAYISNGKIVSNVSQIDGNVVISN